MDTLSYKTISANKATADKQWVLVDADGQTLGRMCSQIARLLRGKHKPTFTPNQECGDFVVITNCEKVKLEKTQRVWVFASVCETKRSSEKGVEAEKWGVHMWQH